MYIRYHITTRNQICTTSAEDIIQDIKNKIPILESRLKSFAKNINDEKLRKKYTISSEIVETNQAFTSGDSTEVNKSIVENMNKALNDLLSIVMSVDFKNDKKKQNDKETLIDIILYMSNHLSLLNKKT